MGSDLKAGSTGTELRRRRRFGCSLFFVKRGLASQNTLQRGGGETAGFGKPNGGLHRRLLRRCKLRSAKSCSTLQVQACGWIPRRPTASTFAARAPNEVDTTPSRKSAPGWLRVSSTGVGMGVGMGDASVECLPWGRSGRNPPPKRLCLSPASPSTAHTPITKRACVEREKIFMRRRHASM